MKQKDISALLTKAEELKALFVLGQRVIPFLEEIFIFVGEIQPLLDEINNSIQDNLKKMPNASKQLSKVTEATELATNEIMDIVDGIVYKVDIIKTNFCKISEHDSVKKDDPVKLLESLHQAISQGKDLKPILPFLANTIGSLKKINGEENKKIIKDTDELIQSIQNDSDSIMISLQVQDITAQQIAAVNNLLETVQAKLSNILTHFQQSDISDLVKQDTRYAETTQISNLHRPIAFDPDAVDSITHKLTRQQQVDDYMHEHNNKADDESTSQDDLDALFASGSIDEDEEKNNSELDNEAENNENIAKTNNDSNEDDAFAQFSQDDIDALFGK